MKKYNIGISLFLIIISVAMFLGASKMPAVDGTIGPGTWPKILSVVMIVLALLLLLQTLKESSQREAPFVWGPGLKRVLLGTAILAGFCIILYFFGFIAASALMIPAIMLLFGEKRPLILLGTTAGVLLFVYIIFSVVLNLPLPQGIVLS